jgi:hypothetical protein
MDQLTQYRDLVQQVLEKHSQVKLANEEIKVYQFFDPQNDHYQVFHVGWQQYRRVFGPLIHIDIIDNKIWIQYDGTEYGVANELVELGIPKPEIVLGYHAPLMRQYDEFGVG